MSEDELLEATWRALCTHGYADLTMQDIADETDKSKSTLHYHYDSKQELLLTFLEYVSDRFRSRVREAAEEAGRDPADRLEAVIDAAFSPPETADLEDIQTALLELKARAPYDESFRDRIETSDRKFRSLLEEILTDGVADGSFAETVDPEETARFLSHHLAGAQLRQVSVGQDPETGKSLLETHLGEHVYADREEDVRGEGR